MGNHWLWSVQLSLEPLHSVQLTYYVRDMRRCRLGLLRCMGCPAGKVVSLDQEAGKSFSYEEIKNAVETNKPAVLFLCQVCIHCPAGAPLGTGRPPSRQSSSCARRVFTVLLAHLSAQGDRQAGSPLPVPGVYSLPCWRTSRHRETAKPAVLFLCQVCIHCPAGAPLGTGRPPSRQSSSCARRVRRPAGAPLGTGQPCCVVFQSCSGEHARVPRELSIYGSGSNAHGLELPHPPAAHACAETHRRCLPTMQHSTVRTMQ